MGFASCYMIVRWSKLYAKDQHPHNLLLYGPDIL